MRKALVAVLGVVMMATALSGCQSYWFWNAVKTGDNTSVSTRGEAPCSIDLPTNQPSGWVWEKLENAKNYNIVAPDKTADNWFRAHIDFINPQTTFRYPGSSEGIDAVLWNNYQTLGAKRIVGIWPGESYYMAYDTNGPDKEAEILSYVSDSSGATLSTTSNCGQTNE